MPLQGMRKNIRKTHHPNRQKHHTKTIILRMPTLHVKTRHNHRQHENRRRKTSRIPQSIRVTSKMRPLLQPPKRPTTRRTPPRRMPPLPKSPPMQPTQKIIVPPVQTSPSLAKVFMAHTKLSFSATQPKRQNTRGCRLAWSRLVDLGSIDPGSNPGSPTTFWVQNPFGFRDGRLHFCFIY